MLSSSSLALRSQTPEMKPVISELQHSNQVESSTSGMKPSSEPCSSEPLNFLAQPMTTLVRKIQDLRHIGIEDAKITLPKICVIGDQSTGKSSLIEGMSEIKVPRSSGTCTRCPMEINLSESEFAQPWTCRVYLSRKYVYDGSKKLGKPRKSQPLGPWHMIEQDDEHFVTITDKGQIEEVIKWAQLAILNPGSATANYIPGKNMATDPDDCEVKFSPNIVRLDISAQGFPNLSFYDLPGVINQVEFDDERYLVNLVENLVKEYISQDSCIVLLTITMTDDVMNSSAARIMNDVRGAKQRALGVLTKPDRVPPGESYAQWVEILEGDKFALGHDYYVVRNNPDPSVPHAISRQEEHEFFLSPPWVTELAAYHERFGTRNLQTALSRLLLEQIMGCLPLIIDEINKKATRIEDELSRLPAPPSANIPYILCEKLYTFKERIRCQIDGGSREYPLQKLWNNIAEDFKRALAKTRPTVKLLADIDMQSISVGRPDDSDCEFMQSTPKRKLDEDPANSPSPAVRGRAKKPLGYHTEHFNQFTGPAREFTWEDIRDINKDSASAGIPQQINPKAIDCMNQMSVVHWKEPMMTFIDASHQLMKETLLHELNKAFIQYTQTGLFRELEKIIRNYLRKLRVDHHAQVEELYEIEYHKPFTMANSTLDKATVEAHRHLETRRFDARANRFLELQQKYSAGDPRRENEKKKLGVAELGVDVFTLEVRMMAITRGYYEVASSRFVDSVCQTVYTKLFSKCRGDLVKVIENDLGIMAENAVERCTELMSEDVERQRRRQYLEKQKEKVMKAQEWLNEENSTADCQDELVDFGPEIKLQPLDSW
ncbi:P-loop containing nucleoside triphosphate hydrolase protein [Aspergillus aurantiobrunneus]